MAKPSRGERLFSTQPTGEQVAVWVGTARNVPTVGAASAAPRQVDIPALSEVTPVARANPYAPFADKAHAKRSSIMKP